MMKIRILLASVSLACIIAGCAALGHPTTTITPGTPPGPNGEPGTPATVSVTGFSEPWNSLIVGFAPLLAYLGGRRVQSALATAVAPKPEASKA